MTTCSLIPQSLSVHVMLQYKYPIASSKRWLIVFGRQGDLIEILNVSPCMPEFHPSFEGGRLFFNDHRLKRASLFNKH